MNSDDRKTVQNWTATVIDSIHLIEGDKIVDAVENLRDLIQVMDQVGMGDENDSF